MQPVDSPSPKPGVKPVDMEVCEACGQSKPKAGGEVEDGQFFCADCVNVAEKDE